ncbi:MAG: Asp-tRNA(Asn)/Glu-tRNA(Gln) amidotransferase subunit GatC [bacterium]|nr:Asp-tRNA(Asn)/Glu-tRNA(Gln) amidotransferase subunit GatC [bacterium]
MSQFSNEDIKKLAELAHIEIEEDEIETFRNDLEKIISYVNRLSELDLTNVEPMQNPYDSENFWREDIVQPSLPQEEVLKNAPRKAGPFFVFPRIVPQKKGERLGEMDE